MTLHGRLSFRWRKRTPLILQAEAGECGLACLAMVASHYGYATDLASLRRTYSVTSKGQSLSELVRIAHDLKLVSRPLRAELEGLRHLKCPCVLHWQFNHFVVLTAVKGGRAFVLSPSNGAAVLSMQEMSAGFTGVAVELWPGANFQKEKAPPALKLRQLGGHTSGLRSSFLHVLSLAVPLEIFTVAMPMLMQMMIDAATGPAQSSNLLGALVAAYAVFLVMQIAIRAARSWATLYFGTTFNLQWRANIFAHLLRLPVAYFEKRHLGDIMSRMASLDEIQRTVSTSFLEALLDGALVVVLISVMFLYAPTLALVVCLFAVTYAAFRISSYPALHKATQREIAFGAKEDSLFVESVRGIKTIKLFQREEERRVTWLNAAVDRVNCRIRVELMKLSYEGAKGALSGAERLAVLWLASGMVMDQRMTIGALVAFLVYMAQFDDRVSKLIDNALQLKVLKVHAQRLSDVALTEPEDVGVTCVEQTEIAAVPTICVHNLCFAYGPAEPEVLSDVSFEVASGECVAIVGPSGCGKTTLINVILGILRPTRGEVLVGGLNVRNLGYGNLRGIVGVVMQEDALFSGSILENISFFDPNPDFEHVRSCATLAEIHDDIHAMPMRYNTPIGDMGSVLSGGQKQRLLLARALYKKPKVLILDEATSHLDVELERQVTKAVMSLKLTRIVVAHRPETIRAADRVVHLNFARRSRDSGLSETRARASAATAGAA